jgi:hypothetical protein
MMTADESKVVDQQEVVLGEELHSMQYVGIDTDSSRGASTVKADFLYMNSSKAATAGKSLHGVGGGIAACGGVGPMGVANHCRRRDRREEGLLIEPEGQYITKTSPLDPDLLLSVQSDPIW